MQAASNVNVAGNRRAGGSSPAVKMKKSGDRFNYGWVVVGVTVISMALVYGVRHSFPIFYPSILSEFGWLRGDTAAILSINILVYGFSAPLAGHLADQWKPRRVMILGLLLLVLATAGCSLASRLWHFFLLFGVGVPMGSAFCGWPLFSPALTNWFTRRRGLVLGLGQMGGGLSFVYGLLVEFFITWVGWRFTFLALAVLLVFLVLPLVSFFFSYRPEDKIVAGGTNPDATHGVSIAGDYWTLFKAMKNGRLWLFVVSEALFWGLGGYLVLAHQVKFATDAGYSSLLSASIFALFGVFMLTGQFASLISDWIGREITATMATVLVLGAIISLLGAGAAGEVWLLYLYSVLFGLGMGLFSPTPFAGAADVFHGRYFGGISGLLLAGLGVGGVIGPWLGGVLYDRTGTYTVSFVISGASFLAACAAYWIAAPRKGAARLSA